MLNLPYDFARLANLFPVLMVCSDDGAVELNVLILASTINLDRITPFSINLFNVMDIIWRKFKWVGSSFEKIEHQFTLEIAFRTQTFIGF